MNVQELIEELQKYPSYMEVYTLEQLDWEYDDYVEALRVKTWEISDNQTVVVLEG